MMTKDRERHGGKAGSVNRGNGASAFAKKAQYDAKTVEMTLDCPLAGCIPEDDSVAACSQKGRIALECDGPARRALRPANGRRCWAEAINKGDRSMFFSENNRLSSRILTGRCWSQAICWRFMAVLAITIANFDPSFSSGPLACRI
ncbi:MAG: hypothetical protein ACLUHE_17395 [Christensenellales bacterium]